MRIHFKKVGSWVPAREQIDKIASSSLITINTPPDNKRIAVVYQRRNRKLHQCFEDEFFRTRETLQ